MADKVAPPLPDDEAYITPDELAALFKVSVDTVRKWREMGTGPVVTKLGPGKNSLVRYAVSDVNAWRLSNRVPNPSAASGSAAEDVA